MVAGSKGPTSTGADCHEKAWPSRPITGDWNFYLAFSMFRIAGILQGIMKRVVDGTASSAQAADAGKRARPMAEMGWEYAKKAKQ